MASTDGDGHHKGSGSDNRILDALPEQDLDRLSAQLTPVDHAVTTVLSEPGSEIDSVYFPLDGVVSLVTPLAEGAVVEVATIGNEGIVGVPLALSRGIATVRAVSQVSGRSLRMPTSLFITEVQRGGALGALVQSYVAALFTQVAQASGCNRLHSNEQRLSRWLLMSHDRVGRDDFPITQVFLAQMLGSRRATVTLSAGVLQGRGLIRYRRGQLTIVNREGLERAACSCYRIIKDELDSVVGRALRPLEPHAH
ncbi:MAG: Crp/Fnr family transcriptional regulator [Candidatus Dormibacteria bacterium]